MNMPKVELHVHLEGATDAQTIWDLAKKNHVSLPAANPNDWQSMYQFRDFPHFVEIYMLAASCMKSPEDFAFMTERFIANQSKQNIKYCEVFLSGSFLVGKMPLDELVDALAESAQKGEKEYGTKVRFIPDIGREMPDTSQAVLDFTLMGQKKGIFIGLGLGGMEAGFPPELFTDVYIEARRNGLRLTAHAGETEGAPSVWGAIRNLKAERIGHGIRSLDDPELITYLRKTLLPLDVSPHSNYCLKATPLDELHPIRALVDQGVFVTLNSDDPAMFSTNLNQEYLLLAQQGFSWEELWQINLNGLEASFLTEEEKNQYHIEWEKFIK